MRQPQVAILMRGPRDDVTDLNAIRPFAPLIRDHWQDRLAHISPWPKSSIPWAHAQNAPLDRSSDSKQE